MKTDCSSYNFMTTFLIVNRERERGENKCAQMQDLGSTRRTGSPFWEGLLFFLTIVMAVGIIGYVCGVLLHIAVKHTYFDPASPIGVLISDRYVTLTWWVLALSSLQSLIPAMVYFVWIDKWLRNTGWIVLWVFIVVLLVTMQLFVVIHLGGSNSNCNGQGQAGNLCNDLLWCCVPDIYLNVVNECPPGPCGVAIPAVPIPATIDDLSPDGMFQALLWFNVAFLIISGLIMLILIGTLVYSGRYSVLKKVRRKKTSSPPEEQEEELIESEVVMNTGEKAVTRRRKSPPSNLIISNEFVLEVPVTTLITRKMGSKNE